MLKTFLTILISGTLFFAGFAFGLPCNGKEVIPGETPSEVTAKCGTAALREQRTVTVKETDKTGQQITTTNIEELTYAFGPDEVMQTYHFENGAVTEIRSVGYGRSLDDRGEHCQNGQLLSVGDTTVDAYLKCGEPLAREKKADKVTTEKVGEDATRDTIVSVVEWTYRYGPDLPGYTLRFENGRVTDITPREFGK